MKPADTALEGLCAHDQHLTNEGELDLRLHVPIFLVSRTRYMRAIFFLSRIASTQPTLRARHSVSISSTAPRKKSPAKKPYRGAYT